VSGPVHAAVVGEEDHDGALRQLQVVQRVEQCANSSTKST